MTDQERWIDKIQKLLAKAERAGTPAEAEAFQGKAEELMVKYAVDHAVLAAARNTEEQIVERVIEHTGIYQRQSHELASYVCDALGSLRTLISDGSRYRQPKPGKYKGSWEKYTKTYVIGFESDVENALVLIASLQVQAHRAQLSWWQTEQHRLYSWHTSMDKFRMRRSFLTAFNEEVWQRIYRTRRQVVKEASATTPGTDLVLKDRGDRVKSFIDSKYDLVTKKSRALQTDPDGARAGRLAGASADIGQTGVGRTGGRSAIGGKQ